MYLNLKSSVIYGDVLIISSHLSSLRILIISQVTHKPMDRLLLLWNSHFILPHPTHLFYWDIINISLTTTAEFLLPMQTTDWMSECLFGVYIVGIGYPAHVGTTISTAVRYTWGDMRKDLTLHGHEKQNCFESISWVHSNVWLNSWHRASSR